MREYKINMDRPDPTPEEIAANKDFSKVLSRYSTLTKPVYRQTWFLSTAVLVVAAGFLVLVNLFDKKQDPVKEVEQEYVYQPTQLDLLPEDPFVNPPLDGVDIEYETYVVETGEQSQLDYHTGTKLNIPKNAFVDADGQDIDGKVDVKYREFHDVADFFVSGIPMEYDSAGTTYTFESAGMMEILAFQNGEPVFLKPDKEIKVEMISNYDGKEYNVYKLDEANERWEYRGKDQVTPTEGFDQRHEPINALIAGASDADKVEEDYWYNDVNRGTEIVPKRELSVKKLAKELATAEAKVEKLEKAKPLEPKKINKAKYNFDLEVDPKEFPEIATYEGTRFEVGDETKDFTAEKYKINWEDVLLEEREPGISYNLTLIKGDMRYTCVVYPVFDGENYLKAKEVFKKKFGTYKKKLDIRKTEEKAAKEAYEAELAEYEAKRLEQIAEWEAQKKKYEEEQREREKRFTMEQKVTRAFNITSFGSWNCDSPIRQPRGASLNASFTDMDDNELKFSQVFLVQKDRNALFTYAATMFNKLKFNPREKNVFWGITKKGHLAIFRADRFSEIPKNSGKFTFKMEVIDDKFVSVKEVRDAINI